MGRLSQLSQLAGTDRDEEDEKNWIMYRQNWKLIKTACDDDDDDDDEHAGREHCQNGRESEVSWIVFLEFGVRRAATLLQIKKRREEVHKSIDLTSNGVRGFPDFGSLSSEEADSLPLALYIYIAIHLFPAVPFLSLAHTRSFSLFLFLSLLRAAGSIWPGGGNGGGSKRIFRVDGGRC